MKLLIPLRALQLLAVIVALMSPTVLHAQNYNLSVTNEPYVELTNATPVTMHWTDDENPTTPLMPAENFSFTLLSTTYTISDATQFRISKWGAIELWDDKSFTSIDGWFTSNTDSLQPSTQVSIQVDGAPGDRVIKTQFKNIGIKVLTPSEYVNHQIWLYEKTGMIQLRYGPVALYDCDPNVETPQGPFVGLFKAKLPSGNLEKVYWFTGDPLNPKINKFNITSTLQCYPPSGTVYTMNPGTASVALPIARSTAIRTTVQDRIYLAERPDKAMLYDIRGVKVREWSEPNPVLEIGDLPNGVYQLRLEIHNGFSCHNLIKIRA